MADESVPDSKEAVAFELAKFVMRAERKWVPGQIPSASRDEILDLYVECLDAVSRSRIKR